jgi:ABC-type Fe3+-hydroxamate transport system substrate-binding protein
VDKGAMNRSAIITVFLLALLGAAGAWGVSALAQRGTIRDVGDSTATDHSRIVSLAPAVTETLFAIGAGPDVVGRTAYCDFPPAARELPSVGTSLTPQFEDMARLEPTLIVGEATKDAPLAEFRRLAPTKLLRWLSLGEICDSIRELGRLTERRENADKLAADLWTKLNVPRPEHGPRVLMTMHSTPGQLKEVTFLRQNSLHGACLNAAGARNAVPEQVVGVTPILSLERVIALDPDVVIVLTLTSVRAEERARIIADWNSLPMLKAVKNRRIRVLDGREYYVNGPRIVGLIDKLKEALR